MTLLDRDVDVWGLQRDLRAHVEGEVRFDRGTRAIYSHDASNFRHVPLGVVVPRTTDAIVAAVEACRRHGAPVLNRGAGTSLSGETTNTAIVVDSSKYLREIVEVDAGRRTARVQPGVIRDQLSDRTEAEHHLTFAPDTSTHAWATFGGMIGNNSCGIHSVMAGRTSDNVEELDILLYDGTRMRVGLTNDEDFERVVRAGGRPAEIHRRLRELRDRHADEIRARFPRIPRRVSGFNLDELLPENGFHLARALVGTEGTCATVLEATVRLVDSPPSRSTLVLGYPTIFEAADHVPEILEHGPVGLEAIDSRLIGDMVAKHMHDPQIPLLPEGEGWLLVEFGGWDAGESHGKAERCMRALRGAGAPEMKLFDDVQEAEQLWQLREDGLGATAFLPTERDHWPGWEDAAVPPSRLGGYLRDYRDLLGRHGHRAALYGHFGDGCVHCRIDFDLQSPGGVREYRRFMEEAADLVVSYGGSLSGEHGDGQQRAELLPKMFGDRLVGAFGEFKAIWDPDGAMNPGRVVDPHRLDEDLKLGPDYNHGQIASHFAYPADGGSFAHAAGLRCVGVGRCRDVDSGTMCPSYMATREEKHTTRGRAKVLFEMLEGETITDGFRSDAVHDALDLCLSCKGCKGDCPVNVDMATYKAEFLSRYFKRRLRPRAAYSMGLIMLHARLASRAPRTANAVMRAPVLSGLLKRAGGIAPQRDVPPFAAQTFRAWWRERGGAQVPDGKPVVLFCDTFSDFLQPEIARATALELEDAGFRVVVPQTPLCCGRPLYDYGMLPTARRFLERLIAVLAPYVRRGVHVVGIEPSCVAVLRDELPNMLPQDADARRLALHTLTLAELLTQQAPDGYEPPRLDRRVLVHLHCHHQAVMGRRGEQELLESMGCDAAFLDTGCCGLAGSFGFEAGEKYEVSMKVAEHRFAPMLRDAPRDALLLGDGFSCRTQAAAVCDRRPLHLAQLLRLARAYGPSGPPGAYPEQACRDAAV